MQYRNLGHSGLRLSCFSFGSWVTFSNQVDQSLAYDLMKTAYDSGVNFFDNAEVYADGESERIMGEVLSRASWSRDTYCVSSKVFWGGEKPTQRGLSHKHIFDACHSALRRMKLEYLDLFFCHRPDHQTPIEETVRAMNILIQQGKILYWGTSEWSATQIMQAHSIAREHHLIGPKMEQPEYNMFHRERVEKEYEPLYKEIGLGTTVWSPLASGILTGKYSSGIPSNSRAQVMGEAWTRAKLQSEKARQRIAKAEELRSVAKDLDSTLAQLALAWCLRKSYISTVILGASKKDQLLENLAALKLLDKWSEDLDEKIESVLDNRPDPFPIY